MAVRLFPKLVLFGNSLTQKSFSEGGWGATLADYYQRKCDVLNRGFSGYTSAYNKFILPKVLQSDNNPKGSAVAAIVLLGSNDAVCNETDPRGLTVEQYATNLMDILTQFMNDGMEASQLVLLTPPAVADDKYKECCAERDVPVSLWDARVKPFAEKCADVGKKLGVEVVDLYKLFHEQPNWESFVSDGLHFSKEGNLFVAQQVIPVLDSKLGHLPMIFPDWKDVDPKHPDKYFCNN